MKKITMEKILGPFYKISLWIMRKIPLETFSSQARRLEEELSILSRTGEKQDVQEYYAKKLAVLFAILFWGGGLCMLAELALAPEKEELIRQSLERPEYGQGSQETELSLALNGQELTVPVEIGEKQYTQEEIGELFAQAMEELDEKILGENTREDEIRKDLYLPEYAQGEAVAISWSVQPEEWIDKDGRLTGEPPKEGVLVELTGTLYCQEEEAEYIRTVKVFPKEHTKEEETALKIKQKLEEADADTIYENSLALPKELEGEPLVWSKKQEQTGVILYGLTICIGLCLFFRQDQEIHKEIQKRRIQLRMDYPELLFRMTMLLGAGMTIKGAFSKIAFDYKKQGGKEIRYVYEEMLAACYEMEAGVGEARAYENFGNRCQESCYVKLGSILAQNLRKGSAGLTDTLEAEARMGMEEHKAMVRKLGEEAGTKLLIPMILMLAVVLIILMVPAMLAF